MEPGGCFPFGYSPQSHFAGLNSLSFHVDKGEFVVIMGRSSCGKTTLLNILGPVDTFDNGAYSLDSQDVARLSKSEQAKIRGMKLGFVFRSYNLLQELNCRDNIAYTCAFMKLRKSAS